MEMIRNKRVEGVLLCNVLSFVFIEDSFLIYAICIYFKIFVSYTN